MRPKRKTSPAERDAKCLDWLRSHRKAWRKFVATRASAIKRPELAQDIRYWEARVCGFDYNDIPQVIWFFALSDLTRMSLCKMSRACRDGGMDVTNKIKRRPL